MSRFSWRLVTLMKKLLSPTNGADKVIKIILFWDTDPNKLLIVDIMEAWGCVFITKPLTTLHTHISLLSLTAGVTVCTVVWLPVFGDISDGSERRGVNTRRSVFFCFVFWLQGSSCWWLGYWVGGALHSLPISPPPPPDIQKTAVATGSACAQTWYTHTPNHVLLSLWGRL